MVYFLTTQTGAFTLGEVRRSRIRRQMRILDYDSALQKRHFAPGTYIFTDIDRLHYRQREEAARLYLHLRNEGCPVLNDPALVQTRYPLLRTLHQAGINQFSAQRASELAEPLRFPVFIRNCHEHGRPFSDLLHSLGEVHAEIARIVQSGCPREHLIVVEYAAEPVRPGLFLKYSAFRMGGQILPHTTVHEGRWLVKWGTMGIGVEEDYLQEQRMLLAQPYAFREILEKVFRLADIEYGRADFSLYQGQPQIYEINTNPHVTAPRPHPFPTRERNQDLIWHAYLDAVLAMDTPSLHAVASFPAAKKPWSPPHPLQEKASKILVKLQFWNHSACHWAVTRMKQHQKALQKYRAKKARDRQRRSGQP